MKKALWHGNMKKIIGACSALVIAVLFGLMLADKALAFDPPPPSPAPTNAAPASVNGAVSNNSGLVSQQ